MKKHNPNPTPHALFKLIVDISGAGVEQILEFNDAQSYDHTNLALKLQSKDYGEVFPILKSLLRSSEIVIPIREKISKVFVDSIFAENQIRGENDDFLEE